MSTYTIWSLSTRGNGKIFAHMETNDDNDDGYPDGEVVVWEREISEKTAYQLAGKHSRIGLYGQPVDVYLDGRKI